MPPLMHSALLKVDTEVVDEADADADDEGIATVLVQTDTGSKRVALKTSLLEEKATACNMLVCYFSELGEGMFNYIETVAMEMVKLLSYVYSEEVRTAAAALMPELIKAAVHSRDKGLCDQSFVAGLSKLVFEKLITTVKEEPETDVQLAMIEGLQVCMCVRLCLRERERQSERETEKRERENVCSVCMYCVCVCIHAHTHTQTQTHTCMYMCNT